MEETLLCGIPRLIRTNAVKQKVRHDWTLAGHGHPDEVVEFAVV